MGFTLPDSNSITDPQVLQFLERYYEISNHAPSHDEFADLFIQDGEYGMNAKKAKGRDNIRAFRKAIFSHVPRRDHTPIQFCAHGGDQYDLMVHGDVTYGHHLGHETGSDWAAIYKLVKVREEIKMRSCHIIVDSKAHI